MLSPISKSFPKCGHSYVVVLLPVPCGFGIVQINIGWSKRGKQQLAPVGRQRLNLNPYQMILLDQELCRREYRVDEVGSPPQRSFHFWQGHLGFEARAR